MEGDVKRAATALFRRYAERRIALTSRLLPANLPGFRSIMNTPKPSKTRRIALTSAQQSQVVRENEKLFYSMQRGV